MQTRACIVSFRIDFPSSVGDFDVDPSLVVSFGFIIRYHYHLHHHYREHVDQRTPLDVRYLLRLWSSHLGFAMLEIVFQLRNTLGSSRVDAIGWDEACDISTDALVINPGQSLICACASYQMEKQGKKIQCSKPYGFICSDER